jgi:succinate dehydrogenase hydrophobic anchor subunit
MKITAIIIMFTVIAMLWVVAHILYKPIFDRISQQYVINEDEFKIANICIAVMLALALTIGLLL